MEECVGSCVEQEVAKKTLKQTLCKKIPSVAAWLIIGVASVAVLATLLVLIGQA